MLKYFEFFQNNAGGFYVANLPVVLFVLAETAVEANTVAEMFGVDFDDGCSGCCGDRWVRAVYDSEGLGAEDYRKAVESAESSGWSHRLVSA